MIVDSSAIIAILARETGSERYVAALSRAGTLRLSAATYLETSIVVDSSRSPIASSRLDQLIRESGITIEPVTREDAVIARQAYRDFGKGSGHPAGLNFGDCFAYALAKLRGEPLLYKGSDFSHTDIRSALD